MKRKNRLLRLPRRKLIMAAFWAIFQFMQLQANARDAQKLPVPEEPASSTRVASLLGLSPDGKRVASLIGPYQLQISDVDGKLPALALELAPCKIEVFSHTFFSPYGKWVAHRCRESQADRYLIWDARSGKRMGSFACPVGGSFAAWNRDETRFAVQCILDFDRNELVVWDAPSLREVARCNMPRKAWIVGMVFDDSGQLLVSTTDATVRVFDPSLRLVRSRKLRQTIYWMTTSLQNKWIAGFTSERGMLFRHNGEVYALDRGAGNVRKLTTLDSAEANLWTVSDDGALMIIDLSGGIKWFPENTRIAPVVVYSLKEKRYLKTLTGNLVTAVFTPDGRIVAITEDSEIRIWRCCGQDAPDPGSSGEHH